MAQLKAAAGPNPVRETAEFCNKAYVDVMNAQLDKMSETLGALIRAEVVWLDNQAQQRVSNSGNAMTGLVSDSLNKAKNDVSSHVEAAKEEIIVGVNSASLRLKEEIIEAQKELSHSSMDHTDLSMKVTAEKNSENLDRVKHELMENTKIVSLKLREDLLRSQREAVQNTQGRTERTVKESLDKVHTNLDKTKRDLVALVEGQSQIVRDRIAGPLPRQRKYVCDFYIENFRQLISSGKEVTSLPWHINQFDSSVRGYADFPLSGKMNVCLMYGRNPHELGLQLRSGVMFKAKAVITCTSGQLPELEVGEVTSPWQEEGIKDNKYRGKFLGAVLCNELLEMGYGQKEGYLNGALLVRYEIEVL